jgi:hypothetical protein
MVLPQGCMAYMGNLFVGGYFFAYTGTWWRFYDTLPDGVALSFLAINGFIP